MKFSDKPITIEFQRVAVRAQAPKTASPAQASTLWVAHLAPRVDPWAKKLTMEASLAIRHALLAQALTVERKYDQRLQVERSESRSALH